MIARMKASGFRCSFCGKSRAEVTDLVAGAPHAAKGRPSRNKSSFICNECVRRFNQHLASDDFNGTLVSAENVK